jgi:hypothetical protein
MSCAVLTRVVRTGCSVRGTVPSAHWQLSKSASRRDDDRVKIALCACFPPKVHAALAPGVPGLLCDVSKQHVAEGHSNATIRLSG